MLPFLIPQADLTWAFFQHHNMPLLHGAHQKKTDIYTHLDTGQVQEDVLLLKE